MNEGKKDRRDPIRTIKAKNPVAKNASAAIGGGAAGAHKDKKKAMKQGDVKHKKAEYAESYEQHLQNKLDEAAKVDPNAKFDYDAWSKSGKKPRAPGSAVKALAQQTRDANAKKKEQGVAEGSEQITELRDRMYQYIKSIVPAWPDYVVQDWLYKGGKTDTKDNIIEKISGAGLTPNSKWQLVPNMKFTMDMFDPMTKQRLVGRAGGTSDLGMGIPKDKERHATQAALAQQQGGVRKEPVLLIKTAKGYELLEGWHRTIQHFAKYPEGYTGPAYVAVAQGQQGVAEGGYDYNKPDPAWVTINGKRWKWFFNYVSARKAMDTLNAKYRKEGSNKKADWEPAELEDNPDYGIKVSEAMNGITGPGRMDGPLESADYDQGEYDDEAGMIKNDLHTIIRVSTHLERAIESNENLPTWVIEKIAQTKGMIVSVMDYIISQHEMGVEPTVSEASALEKFRKDSAEREKKHSDIEAKRKANAAQGKTDVKGAVDRLEKAVKGEGWTHDSLADELFEHERTYEERLQNQLRLKLSK